MIKTEELLNQPMVGNHLPKEIEMTVSVIKKMLNKTSNDVAFGDYSAQWFFGNKIIKHRKYEEIKGATSH